MGSSTAYKEDTRTLAQGAKLSQLVAEDLCVEYALVRSTIRHLCRAKSSLDCARTSGL